MKSEPMRILLLFFLAAGLLPAQSAPENPPTTCRILYVDRPPTAEEVAAAESSNQPLEPTVYYLAPSAEKTKPEFVPLFLPFSRLTSPVTLPAGSPLGLYSKPDTSAKFAEISPDDKKQVVAVLRASRDQAFRDAKVEILDTSEAGFPFGQMRVINASDRKAAIKTLDPAKVIEAGGVLTFRPTAGRRDTVPVFAGVQEGSDWREIHSGATKVRANNRVLLLISGKTLPDGKRTYAVEYLAESAPTAQEAR